MAKKPSIHTWLIYAGERIELTNNNEKNISTLKSLFKSKADVDEINALRFVLGDGPVTYHSCGIFDINEQMEMAKEQLRRSNERKNRLRKRLQRRTTWRANRVKGPGQNT